MPYVYFAGGDKNGLVKIGFSKDPKVRLASLQTKATGPVTLLAVMPAENIQSERAVHAKFAHLAKGNEWFQHAPELRSFIEEAKRHLVPAPGSRQLTITSPMKMADELDAWVEKINAGRRVAKVNRNSVLVSLLAWGLQERSEWAGGEPPPPKQPADAPAAAEGRVQQRGERRPRAELTHAPGMDSRYSRCGQYWWWRDEDPKRVRAGQLPTCRTCLRGLVKHRAKKEG